MRHKAIYLLYPQAIRIGDIAGVFDVNGNKIDIDESLVQNKIAELQSAEPIRLLKEKRNQLLAESDWRFLSDQTPSQAWIDYRQALRDLPANSTPELDENGQLTNITWPEKPE